MAFNFQVLTDQKIQSPLQNVIRQIEQRPLSRFEKLVELSQEIAPSPMSPQMLSNLTDKLVPGIQI